MKNKNDDKGNIDIKVEHNDYEKAATKVYNILKNKIELSDEELELKQKLEEIDKKIDGLARVAIKISKKNKNSLCNEEIFDSISTAIAISAATDIVCNYFGIPSLKPGDFF